MKKVHLLFICSLLGYDEYSSKDWWVENPDFNSLTFTCMRILLVEDEEKLAKSIQKGLEAEGYAVDSVMDGDKADRRIELYHKEYDVIVLDLMLPGKDGFEICKSAREKGILVPILVLTARDAVEDKVHALDAGADDYLVKPFSFKELSARLRALLRRPEETLPIKLEVGSLTLDGNKRQAYCNEEELKLTLKEYSLLDYFMRHPGEVLSREDILDHLWGFDFEGFSNVVDVHIKNLRKKLDDGEGIYLETVQGVGYRLKE